MSRGLDLHHVTDPALAPLADESAIFSAALRVVRGIHESMALAERFAIADIDPAAYDETLIEFARAVEAFTIVAGRLVTSRRALSAVVRGLAAEAAGEHADPKPETT